MCGIGGKLSFDSRPDPEVGEQMIQEMTHRGPDAHDIYASDPILLAHCRLSILDLSRAGRQPMTNSDGSVRIVFNGEIYNYKELRTQLDHYHFNSETDTEVLLHLYEEHGVDCLESLRGMFAFAIWDESKDRLFLARDRLGQKPLFYGFDDGTFWFGSTIKTILSDDSVETKPDPDALRSFLTYSFVPHPLTGFDSISRLGPAEYMTVSADGIERDRYWQLSHTDPFDASADVLANQLRAQLRDATRLRMRSDVPVGVFLSGGIDSSITTVLMSEIADADVQTYSIGFDVGEYDELEFARTIADLYGTDHHERTVTPDSMEVLPELIEHCEMPFGDPSVIPTYYVSQAASEEITVALTGDAGDENFAGYDRYTFDWLTSQIARVPKPVRSATKELITALPESIGENTQLQRISRVLDTAEGDPVERYAGYIYIGESSPEKHFGRTVWQGPEPDDWLGYLRTAYAQSDGPTRLDRLMGVDLRTYLPDDLLVKVDRASMAHSLEVRSPFLDHKFVEFAARVPSSYKWRRGKKKWLLKRAFRDDLPEAVLKRSKQGFSVPVDEWFRRELRPLARERIKRLGDRKYFDAEVLHETLQNHVTGTDSNGGELWNVVMLEGWFERFIE